MVEISKVLFVILLILSWIAVIGIILTFFSIAKLDRCSNCGNLIIPEQENYCSNCGAKIDKEKESNER